MLMNCVITTFTSLSNGQLTCLASLWAIKKPALGKAGFLNYEKIWLLNYNVLATSVRVKASIKSPALILLKLSIFNPHS